MPIKKINENKQTKNTCHTYKDTEKHGELFVLIGSVK